MSAGKFFIILVTAIGLIYCLSSVLHDLVKIVFVAICYWTAFAWINSKFRSYSSDHIIKILSGLILLCWGLGILTFKSSRLRHYNGFCHCYPFYITTTMSIQNNLMECDGTLIVYWEKAQSPQGNPPAALPPLFKKSWRLHLPAREPTPHWNPLHEQQPHHARPDARTRRLIRQSLNLQAGIEPLNSLLETSLPDHAALGAPPTYDSAMLYPNTAALTERQPL
jgi:hypothetical protein